MTAGIRQAGFTLVEMLVALALTALVAVLMLRSLEATGLVARTDRRMGAQADVQIVREHLRRTFADLAGRRIDGRHPPFLGLPDSLVAVVAANREVERGSALRVGLALLPQPARPGLALVETRSAVAGSDGADEPETLLDGIAGLSLRYFGVQGQDPQPRWQPNWSRRDRPPFLVEIAVAFPPSDRRRWPALVVPLGTGS